MKRRSAGLALALGAALTGGCATNVTALSQDCEGPGGWCPNAVTVASNSWQYAQIAQNVYWERSFETDRYTDRLYVLPDTLKERFASANDDAGFAYSVFDRFDGDKLVEVVLAFRGTEGPTDWLNGNLRGRQGPRGVVAYRLLRAGMDETGNADVPITVVGHSLGGRIAARVIKEIAEETGGTPPLLSSYMFNTTSDHPLQRRGFDRDTVHVAISEKGEAADYLRRLSNATWDGYEINCRPGLDPIGGHYMRYLADCLTWIAARSGKEAAESVRRNELSAPPAEVKAERP